MILLIKKIMLSKKWEKWGWGWETKFTNSNVYYWTIFCNCKSCVKVANCDKYQDLVKNGTEYIDDQLTVQGRTSR